MGQPPRASCHGITCAARPISTPGLRFLQGRGLPEYLACSLPLDCVLSPGRPVSTHFFKVENYIPNIPISPKIAPCVLSALERLEKPLRPLSVAWYASLTPYVFGPSVPYCCFASVSAPCVPAPHIGGFSFALRTWFTAEKKAAPL